MDAAKVKLPVYVIDDFHPFPEAIREWALHQEYVDFLGPDGVLYKRVCLIEVPGVTEMLQGVLGPVHIVAMFLRLNYEGEGTSSLIHTDLGLGSHAFVLYLNDGPSGTAFWKHKETGTICLNVGDDWLYEKVCKDWDRENAWERIRYVEMKFNRLVMYESHLFHSRYPFTAFGNSPENGRLIVAGFFTPRKKI